MNISIRVALIHMMTMGAILPAGQAVAGDQTVLVIPARANLVRVGQDVARLRDVMIVSYQRVPGDGAVLMHCWDRRARAWQDLPVETFRGGAYAPGGVGTLYVVGPDQLLPPGLQGAAMDAGRIERIPSLLPVDILNRLNERLRFSRREWRLLASRYELNIVDRNEERRRWGRFGPPGGAPRGAPLRPAPLETDRPLSPMPAWGRGPAADAMLPADK